MTGASEPAAAFDVVTVGRVGVDVYPEQVGLPLEDVERFRRYLGGSAANVAVAARRHGRRTALVSGAGADPFGRFVHRALAGFGVDDRWVHDVPHLPTPVTFCAIQPPDDFPVYFYRWPKAPDLEVSEDRLDLPALAAAHLLWLTVTGLSAEPSRSAHRTALRARGTQSTTVLDLDYRAVLWPSVDEARRRTAEVLPHVSVAVGNLEECEMAVGTRDPHRAATALLDAGVGLAIVKKGRDGVLARSREELVEVPTHPVEVVNGLGAGDAFGGALCHGLLAGWPLERTLSFANTAGAIVAGQVACSCAMPTTDEVRHAMSQVTGA